MANASCSSFVKIDIFAKARIWAEVLDGSVHDTANVLRELIVQIFTYSFLKHLPHSHCESFARERMANSFTAI